MYSRKTHFLYLIVFIFFSGFNISMAQNVAETDSVSVSQPHEKTAEPVADALNQRLSQLNTQNVQNKISFEQQVQLAGQIIRYDYAILILVGLFIGISTRKRGLKHSSQNN